MEMISPFGVTNISPVLLSLSFSMFAVAQTLISFIHDCME